MPFDKLHILKLVLTHVKDILSSLYHEILSFSFYELFYTTKIAGKSENRHYPLIIILRMQTKR